ncbi:anti-sigma factor family protein [Aneurinibacillus tyrosinisolvens]|uniref:anti-sigma factor family protein n=1 Tax=Aneurinibacillus tyrosinisolvens TaxID=1443435 RepID=UPI00063FC45F|nr:zf-HC2 domain-containing protein [Aneurinibacillus tyrosinisolvens]
MKCQDPGFIQAYLDGEINREQRKEFTRHLDECVQCHAMVGEANRLDSWVRLTLDESFSNTETELIHTEAAWQRFEQRLTETASLHQTDGHGRERKETKRSWRTMKKTYKKWLAGTAAAAVLAGSLSIPQVQAAANNLLSIFRVNKVELVKLTNSDLRDIETWMVSGEPGTKEIKGIGKMWLDEETQDHHQQNFETVEEAKKAGYTTPKAPKGYKTENIIIEPKYTLNVQLDTEKANKLLKQMNTGTQFDSKLDGKQFAITVPRSIRTSFTSASRTDGNPWKDLSYTVVDAPQMKVPDNIDLEQVRTTVLSLPFIPENVRQQLAGIQDWQHTLPFPYVEDEKNKTREASIQGVKGVVYESEHETFIIWQKDGKLRQLTAYDTRTNKHTDVLIDIANQLQ